MPKTDQATKQKRIELVYRLIERHPNGLTEAEIAKMLNFGQRSVNNYLRALDTEGKVYKDGLAWFVLPYERTRLRHFELSPEEAMTLYLATRLLVKQHDKRNESAETALTTLANVLTGDAGVGHEIHQAALELAQRPGDESYSRIFRTIMQGYIYRRQVAITYHPLHSRPFQTVLSPYLLEPSAIGYTTYVIGHSSIVNTWRTYKLERIQQATLMREEYTIPSDFPGLEILRHAWSIISGDEVIEVKLRFKPRVTRRVRESRWHPSQQIVDDLDYPGGCIWTAYVADLTDLRPWLRSWGRDVEVLAPKKLREQIAAEARQVAEIYGWSVYKNDDLNRDSILPFDSPVRWLWAKTDRQERQAYATHPLICHLIDVAQVVCALWDQAFPQATRHYFASMLNMDESNTRQWLAFLAGLHDLGKASPVFQRMHPPSLTRLQQLSFDFPDSQTAPHGLISAWALKNLLIERIGLKGDFAHNMAVSIGGHHGTWPTAAEIKGLGPSQRGEGLWSQARLTLFETLSKTLRLAELPPVTSPPDEKNANALLMALAGLISCADWLGSMTEFFSFVSPQIDIAAYTEQAYEQAAQALDQLGWTGWAPPEQPIPFTQLFPFNPRPLQTAILSLTEKNLPPSPALVIIEAPTGEGKTEAAWYLADHWLWANQQRGVYVAMPTQATSNQMLGRVQQFIQQRYPNQRTNLILMHGDAAWSDDMRQLRLAAIDEQGHGTVAAHAWFLPKKRGLLAPFAVGTVDQALMAVLQTRHFFVRMFGLSHKTIIFDEIHAYDTYMNVLFQRLLRWLAAMGTSVILLSATLPAKTRRQLMAAYTGCPFDQPVIYPAITWATAQTSESLKTSEVPSPSLSGVIPLEPARPRTVACSWLEASPASLVDELRLALVEGGCVAIICNTVDRAQQVYAMLQEAKLVPEEDLILFHARFPFYLRNKIEQHVLARFGKAGQRPERAIVVATQVIEQSLDLDFDLLISDLAPLDLILQRIGRLHRHPRDWRPAPLAEPRLFIIQPPLDNELPQFGHDRFIYAPYILLRSYLVLQTKPQITTPGDIQPLIEAVYSDDEAATPLSPAWQQALIEAKGKLEEEIAAQEFMAKNNLILFPNDEDLFRQKSRDLEEDRPELHAALQALTRLTRPTVTLICLHQTPAGLALEPEGTAVVDLETPPSWDMARALAERKVTISRYEVVKHFAGQAPPPGWQAEPLLCHYRPLIFTQGRYRLDERLSLIFDPKRGIIIHKEVL